MVGFSSIIVKSFLRAFPSFFFTIRRFFREVSMKGGKHINLEVHGLSLEAFEAFSL